MHKSLVGVALVAMVAVLAAFGGADEPVAQTPTPGARIAQGREPVMPTPAIVADDSAGRGSSWKQWPTLTDF